MNNIRNTLLFISLNFLLISFAFGQTKEFEFDSYKILTFESGELKFSHIAGSDVKMDFSLLEQLYHFRFKGNSGTEQLIIFKIVENEEDKIIVEHLGDDSPEIIQYLVNDKIESDGLLEFISTESVNPKNDTTISFIFEQDAG